MSAHANAVTVAEYLREVLFRNSIDNQGGPIISTIDCVVAGESERPNEWLNAYWDPDLRQMVYGQAAVGDGLRSLSVNVDIVAHEMFHGVIDSTSRLEYAMQPGALNESYADIFGDPRRQRQRARHPALELGARRGPARGRHAVPRHGRPDRASTSRRTCATSGGRRTRGPATGVACTTTAASTTRPPT